ncbi:MAG TPA: hypothetical protein VK784_12720 [Pseudonocardiaceae bacterium]|nr:hypothetical protein [Pseudonocardiaceae bacterium]
MHGFRGELGLGAWPGDGGWVQAPWTHLRTGPAPFGEQAWDHARQMLARRGQDPVTEAEIAQAAEALLDKAQPQSPPPWDDAVDEDEDTGQLAEVIPLGIFDAHEEAKKWW